MIIIQNKYPELVVLWKAYKEFEADVVKNNPNYFDTDFEFPDFMDWYFKKYAPLEGTDATEVLELPVDEKEQERAILHISECIGEVLKVEDGKAYFKRYEKKNSESLN